MKTHYSILLKWSDADKCYIASLPEFGSYAKTHGDTYEAALQNAKEVLSLLVARRDKFPLLVILER